LSRLSQHIQYTLGLRYLVRDNNGEFIYHPGTDILFENVNKISNLYPRVIEDLLRWQIAFARCETDFLDPVESQLIAHLLDNFPYKGSGRYRCDNGRLQSNAGIEDIMVTMDVSGIKSPAFQRVLSDCFASRFEIVCGPGLLNDVESARDTSQ